MTRSRWRVIVTGLPTLIGDARHPQEPDRRVQPMEEQFL